MLSSSSNAAHSIVPVEPLTSASEHAPARDDAECNIKLNDKQAKAMWLRIHQTGGLILVEMWLRDQIANNLVSEDMKQMMQFQLQGLKRKRDVYDADEQKAREQTGKAMSSIVSNGRRGGEGDLRLTEVELKHYVTFFVECCLKLDPNNAAQKVRGKDMREAFSLWQRKYGSFFNTALPFNIASDYIADHCIRRNDAYIGVVLKDESDWQLPNTRKKPKSSAYKYWNNLFASDDNEAQPKSK
jgi:hypothetical protein